MEKAKLTYSRIRERRQKEVETNRHEERLHGKDGVKDAHTHTRRSWRIMRESWHNVLRPGASSGVASLGNEGREYAPLKLVTTRWVRSCRARLRGRMLLTGAREAWGV